MQCILKWVPSLCCKFTKRQDEGDVHRQRDHHCLLNCESPCLSPLSVPYLSLKKTTFPQCTLLTRSPIPWFILVRGISSRSGSNPCLIYYFRPLVSSSRFTLLQQAFVIFYVALLAYKPIVYFYDTLPYNALLAFWGQFQCILTTSMRTEIMPTAWHIIHTLHYIWVINDV